LKALGNCFALSQFYGCERIITQICLIFNASLFGVFRASASGKGENSKNEKAMEEAYDLGRKIAEPIPA